MDINISNLKETIISKNTTMEALAYEMRMSRSTLYRKLRKGKSGLTIRDVDLMTKALSLSGDERKRIFGGSNAGIHM